MGSDHPVHNDMEPIPKTQSRKKKVKAKAKKLLPVQINEQYAPGRHYTDDETMLSDEVLLIYGGLNLLQQLETSRVLRAC